MTCQTCEKTATHTYDEGFGELPFCELCLTQLLMDESRDNGHPIYDDSQIDFDFYVGIRKLGAVTA